jgi:hypothetical protein
LFWLLVNSGYRVVSALRILSLNEKTVILSMKFLVAFRYKVFIIILVEKLNCVKHLG